MKTLVPVREFFLEALVAPFELYKVFSVNDIFHIFPLFFLVPTGKGLAALPSPFYFSRIRPQSLKRGQSQPFSHTLSRKAIFFPELVTF